MKALCLLSNQEYKLLKLLYRKPRTIGCILNKLHIDDATLQNMVIGELKEYIVLSTNSDNWKQGTIDALAIGKALIEERQINNRRWRVPVIISIIALIKSCDTEIISFVRWLSNQLLP